MTFDEEPYYDALRRVESYMQMDFSHYSVPLLRQILWKHIAFKTDKVRASRKELTGPRYKDGVKKHSGIRMSESTFWRTVKDLREKGFLSYENNGSIAGVARDVFTVNLKSIAQFAEDEAMGRKTGVPLQSSDTKNPSDGKPDRPHCQRDSTPLSTRLSIRRSKKKSLGEERHSPPKSDGRTVDQAIQIGQEKAIAGEQRRRKKGTQKLNITYEAMVSLWKAASRKHGARPGAVAQKDYAVWRRHWKRVTDENDLPRQDYEAIIDWAYGNWRGSLRMLLSSPHRKVPWLDKPSFKVLAYNWENVLDCFDSRTDRALQNIVQEERYTVQGNYKSRGERYRQRTQAGKTVISKDILDDWETYAEKAKAEKG